MAVLDASKCPKAMGDLEKRMAALAARAAAGDPAAAAELRELEKAKNVLAQLAAGKIDVNEALRVLGGQSSVSDLDRQAIAQMSLPALREYLLNSIPRRAMRLQDVTQTNRIRVSGCVVNESELLRVLTRLAPAAERVVCELRIDPNPIVERLTAQLTEAGVRGARVHPFLQEPQHKLLVQMERSSPSKADAARLIALEFIVESDLLELQEVDGPGPTAAPKDADGAGSKVPAPSTLKTGD